MGSKGRYTPTDDEIEIESHTRKGSSLQPEAAAVTLANVGVATGTLNPVAGAVVAAGSLLSAIYKSLPVNKKIAPLEPVSNTWKNRPKANMVKWMMKQSGTSLDKIAAYLGCSVSYLNNNACGYTFVLVNNNEEISSEDSFRVDLLSHFDNEEGEKVLARINAIEEAKKQAKRAEYEAKKAELERMKAEYGFED